MIEWLTSDKGHVALIIAVAAVVTILLRAIPFLIFGGKKTPAFITYLSSVLPYAIMGMLVIYCLKDIDFTSDSHGIPELLSCLTVVEVHLIFSNTLASIVTGTVYYMLFVRGILTPMYGGIICGVLALVWIGKEIYHVRRTHTK